jgi:hypothetical protein
LVGHRFPILCCKFSQNGFFFFSSSSDGKIKIWKTDTGLCINTIQNHTNSVWNFDVTVDCSFLISGCLDGKILLMQESSSTITEIKNKNFKSFLNLQKKLDEVNFEKTFLKIFEKIINLYDVELLYDFFFYFFKEFETKFEKKISKIFQKLNDFNLKFLFYSLTIWNSKRTNSNMIQYILNLFFQSYPFFYLNETNLISIKSLILTTRQNLKKIKKLKKLIHF